MGLLSSTKHYHKHLGDTVINFPDTIKVHEQKAPTDESIRLMEEMHDKAIKNIIAKVKVEDNLVSGECYAIEQPWNMNEIKLIFKFKINGQEFNIEKEISRNEFTWNDQREMVDFHAKLDSMAKGMMLWFALKKFVQVAYQQITKTELPDYLIK